MTDTVKILVVDDDPDIRSIVDDILKSNGYETYQAENGRNALEVLANHPGITCIISDVKMPEMDGMELLRELRQQNNSAIFFFMTGYSPYEKKALITAGAKKIFNKPVDMQTLIIGIKEAI